KVVKWTKNCKIYHFAPGARNPSYTPAQRRRNAEMRRERVSNITPARRTQIEARNLNNVTEEL
ncbi:hypothetical protein NK362_24500, partial [Salmonella enterica]|uniref:hypothetical protein n=1 Tax=Salmonella enterica TaxID=28901 RepID=UPI0022B67931